MAMASTVPKTSVWTLMSYTPPRGPCNQKTSLLTPTCPCLRFMLHPNQATTSFKCHGCSHHASFHALENPREDAVLARWQAQASIKQDMDSGLQLQAENPGTTGRKRKRIVHETLEFPERHREIVDVSESDFVQGSPLAPTKVEFGKARPKWNEGIDAGRND